MAGLPTGGSPFSLSLSRPHPGEGLLSTSALSLHTALGRTEQVSLDVRVCGGFVHAQDNASGSPCDSF